MGRVGKAQGIDYSQRKDAGGGSKCEVAQGLRPV